MKLTPHTAFHVALSEMRKIDSIIEKSIDDLMKIKKNEWHGITKIHRHLFLVALEEMLVDEPEIDVEFVDRTKDITPQELQSLADDIGNGKSEVLFSAGDGNPMKTSCMDQWDAEKKPIKDLIQRIRDILPADAQYIDIEA